MFVRGSTVLVAKRELCHCDRCFTCGDPCACACVGTIARVFSNSAVQGRADDINVKVEESKKEMIEWLENLPIETKNWTVFVATDFTLAREFGSYDVTVRSVMTESRDIIKASSNLGEFDSLFPDIL